MTAVPESAARPTVDAAWGLDDSLARELPDLSVPWQGAPAPDPRLAVVNDALAGELGLDSDMLRGDDGVAVLAGSAAPADASPVAMAYSGHQFGGYVPLLGDGRALLLGELTTAAGDRVDLHLKGSGRTPFARGGDGKAALGPMLREYLVSEAMHALGIPSTRALAVTVTGELIERETVEPGAVLARVSSSHLRVGTFEFAARREGMTAPLADYAIARHYPDLLDRPTEGPDNRYLAFLGAVVEAQAALVARWMLVGFVHGVMNTDNTTISGETIDYGPCAFLDAYDPATVFSSIDRQGRYAYGNQPAALGWNLARFAETLLPLIDSVPDDSVTAATAVLGTFGERYDAHYRTGLAAKLGLNPHALDAALTDDLLVLLRDHGADWTGTFRALADELRGDPTALDSLVPREHSAGWLGRWRDALAASNPESPNPESTNTEIADAMDRVNPVYIPRNHRVDAALRAATAGDLAPFRELLTVVTHPFERRDDRSEFAEPAPAAFCDGFQTFCGT